VHARRFASPQKIDMKNKIPTRTQPGSLTVTDGGTCVGYVVAHGDSYSAFRPDGSLYGEFASQREAVRSLPTINAKSHEANK
jgi:hypothetical protein